MQHPLRAHCKEMSRKGILVDFQLLIARGQEGGIAGGGVGGCILDSLGARRDFRGRGVSQVERYLALAVVQGTIPGNSAPFGLFHSPSGPGLGHLLTALAPPIPGSSQSSCRGEAWLLVWDLQASCTLCRKKLMELMASLPGGPSSGGVVHGQTAPGSRSSLASA